MTRPRVTLIHTQLADHVAEAIPEEPVQNGAQVAEALTRLIGQNTAEAFGIVILDARNRPVHFRIVSRGTLVASLVHPREVFQPAIKANAASVILFHNHPSGVVAPSPEDKGITRRLSQAGDILGIPVLDHVIVAPGGDFHSMLDHGQMPKAKVSLMP